MTFMRMGIKKSTGPLFIQTLDAFDKNVDDDDEDRDDDNDDIDADNDDDDDACDK